MSCLKGRKFMFKETKATQDDFERIANKVSFTTIMGNAILSVLKLIAGIIANSSAMVSDAIHSASDVFSTVVVIIGVKLASKKPDDDHPYGHELFECVAAILLAVVLLITGLGIGINAFENITEGNYNDLEIPGIMALIAAVI